MRLTKIASLVIVVVAAIMFVALTSGCGSTAPPSDVKGVADEVKSKRTDTPTVPPEVLAKKNLKGGGPPSASK